MGEFGWPQIAALGPTVVMLALVLATVVKLAPTWREIKGREFDVREAEAKGRSAQASALTQLGTTLREIAVEQRRATEAVKILQRVNADTSDQMARQMAILTDRVERTERGRENNVEPEGTATKSH